jgi:hypothetical protein
MGPAMRYEPLTGCWDWSSASQLKAVAHDSVTMERGSIAAAGEAQLVGDFWRRASG